jgi:radical SAM superfamily enzyme YgiQ (UPF0313 family)
MTKRLLLISPVAQTGLVASDFNFRLPVLGLLKVAALTPPAWQVTIQDEKVEPLDLDQGADLVGITAMTTTAPRAYQIADHFRRRGVKVVLGGMHPSALPDEARAHCDSVVVGEAEQLWPRLLRDFERQSLQPIYRHENGFPSLEHLPRPNWDLYRDKRYLPVHFVETTRGCPLDCEFCAVTTAFGGRYRNRPVEEVVAELRNLRPFEGRFILRNFVFFVDDNIISNRAYARELLPCLAEFKLKWVSHASMNIAKDPEILRLCQRSGCVGLFIGFETLSDENLLAIGKRINHPHEYLEAVHRIHDHGIGIDASFVFGLDGDDEGVFDRTYDFVQKAKLESPYFSILTPYPGTRLFTSLDAQGRIIDRDWANYNTNSVVYRPIGMTPDQLFDGYYRLQNAVHTVPAIVQRFWGSTSRKNFWIPMNYGFRRSIRKLTGRAMAQRTLDACRDRAAG